MGKKLDVLLGKTDRYSSKVRALAKFALSRIPVLKKQHQSRLSQERSDVAELLRLGHHDRALLRVELVMRHQRILDAHVMIEGYCKLLVERAILIKMHEKECPQELKEVLSSLVFAASRCGELPELHEIRGVATKLYGKEFTAQAVELRSGCGVNPMIMRSLSMRAPSMESRMELLGEIASQNGITLQLRYLYKMENNGQLHAD